MKPGWGPFLGLVLWMHTQAQEGQEPSRLRLSVSSTTLVYGGSLEVRCDGENLPQTNSDFSVQIVKTGPEVSRQGGDRLRPLVLTEDDWVRSTLNGKGRHYTINMTHMDEVTGQRSYVLHIQNVHPLDSGTYSCRLLTQDDTITKVSDEIDVIVQGPPIKLGCDERQVHATLGDTFVTMACHVLSDPPPTISWSLLYNSLTTQWEAPSPYKDDNVTIMTEISDRSYSSHVTWKELLILGRYTMLSRNQYGTSFSYVDVNDRGSTSRPLHYPRFYVSRPQAAEGFTLLLTCITMYMDTGIDVTQIIKMAAAPLSREEAPVDERSQWLILSNDTWLADLDPHIKSRYRLETSIVEDIYTNTTLVITNALPMDSGTYSCGTLDGDIITSEVMTSPKTIIVEGHILYMKITPNGDSEKAHVVTTGSHLVEPVSLLQLQAGEEFEFLCEFRYTHAVGVPEEPTIAVTIGQQDITADMKLRDSVTSTEQFDKNIDEQASTYRYQGALLAHMSIDGLNMTLTVHLPGLYASPESHSVVIAVNGTEVNGAPTVKTQCLCFYSIVSILTLTYLLLSAT